MKRLFKKSLSILLALTMVFGIAPLSGFVGLELPEFGGFEKLADSVSAFFDGFVTKAEAATEYTEGYYTYTVDSNGTATITAVDTSISGDVTIPSTLGGYMVTSIGDYVFKDCSSLTNITIPDSVTNIGWGAFASCIALTSVTIGNGVTNIGIGTFRGCTGLESITIPDGVTIIGKNAFGGCARLTSVTIGNSVTNIGDESFSNCSSLTSVTIPNSVTSIGYSAFACTGLTSIAIPGGVASISWSAFRGCSSLASVTISDGVTSIDNGAFYSCYNLTNVIIPDSVTSIGNGAFERCTGLTNVTIGNGVTTIGDYVFKDCSSLTSITIPDSVTSVGEGVFYDCDSLSNVTIGDNVASIREMTFYSCNRLTSITIPDSVTSVGEGAFYECGSLSNATIGDGVASIGRMTFYRCSRLTRITIPDSVTIIGDNVFYDCTSLANITVDPANTVYSSDKYGVLFNKGKTILIRYPEGNTRTSYKIPDSVTIVGEGAFYGCNRLTSITIPDSVTSIDDNAFEGCKNVTSVTIPDSITSIGDFAFTNCYSLTGITIPDSVTSVGEGAFYNCDSLSNVTIGDNVASIREMTFYSCNRLTSITIPNSVTSIGENAFYNCGSLIDVYYNGTEDEWNAISIGSDNEALYNAKIHYNYSDEGSDNSEEEIDRKAYYGVLEKCKIFILNGEDKAESYISEITVNGVTYAVKKDLISVSDGTSCQNKDVIFIVKDEEVIFFSAADDIQSGFLAVYGADVVGYDYNDNGVFTKDSFDLELNIVNSVSLPGICPPPGSEAAAEYNKNLKAICSLNELKIFVSNVKVSWDVPEAVFSIKSYMEVPINEYISLGNTLTKKISLAINEKYTPPNYKNHIRFTGEMTFTQGINEVQTSTDYHTVIITNYNLYVPPIKDYENTPPTQNPSSTALAKKAATELTKVQGAISLHGSTTLNELLTSEQLNAISCRLLCMIAISSALENPSAELSGDMLDSIFKCNTGMLSVGNNKVISTVAVNSKKYGEFLIEFICDYSEYNMIGAEYAYFGTVNYKIKNGSQLPSSCEKSGFAGTFAGTDITAFCNAAYKLAESDLKSAYNGAWGNIANGAADIVFGKSVNQILSHTKYNSVSGLAWEAFTTPAKKVKIECPVDVYVYNSNNELIAMIKNNKEILSDEKVYIEVNGDTKFLTLFEDSYNIVYKATANGKMSITVTEMANSEGELRTTVIGDIPLNAGGSFEQEIDNTYLSDSDYKLTSNDGTVYTADTDAINLHSHVSNGVYFEENDSTCVEEGWKTTLCSVCNEWYLEILPKSKHADCDDNGYCDNCELLILNTITWIIDGCETKTFCEEGKPIAVPDAPKKDGYTFKGWTPEIPATMPAEDLTFTAVFVADEPTTKPSEPSTQPTNKPTEPTTEPTTKPVVTVPVPSVEIRKPSQTEIKYGDSIILHADVENMSEGATINWTADNGNFTYTVSADGTTCTISPSASGDTTFTATVYDKDGNEIGNDTQTMTAKAGLWQKIVAFFKSIFGLTVVYTEIFKV